MSDVLADTHSVIWFLFDTARPSHAADAALTTAAQSGRLFISAITLNGYTDTEAASLTCRTIAELSQA